ncbi:MAG: hypothetical protein U9O85_11575 [Euryarchaeota archaeon]|nr:hypothetical protein [Euryarchaeota archaeon]
MNEEEGKQLDVLYGLAQDPFALSTPPMSGDRLWCFVDRGLREDSSNSALKGVIEHFSNRIKKQESGNHGLLIVGEWGAGKSHALNQIEWVCKDLTNVRINVRDDKELISADLFKSLFMLAFERKGEKAEDTRFDDITKTLDKTIVYVDQAEDLVSYSEENFLEFFKSLSGLIEYWGARNSASGIVIALTPERYNLLKRKVNYTLDRFDKGIIAEDMSLMEALELVKKNMALVRIKDIDNKLFPFTDGSVSKILDLWRSDRRTIRVFRENCSKVLRAAVDNEKREIDEQFAANAIHKHYGLWEMCLSEWGNLKQKHRVLLLALFNALDKCKDFPDTRYDDVVPEVTREITLEDKIRNDIVVVPHGSLPVALEIERGQISRHKYIKIANLVEEEEFSGVVVITTSFKENIRANKVAMSTLRDTKRYEVIRIREETLKLGRCLSFAALSPDIFFPPDEDVRTELQRSLRRDDALSLIDALGIKNALDKVSKNV